MSVADCISFKNFCQLCVKISEASHEKKISILKNYIEWWKKKGEDLKKNQPDLDDSFYPALQFFLPHLDRARGAYGVKEHTLAKIYIRILALPKDGKDALKLLQYKAPKISGSGAGDFAEVAYWVLRRRCSEGGQLSISEVNKHLDAVATKHALNDPRGIDYELILLFKATSEEEQKWLIRILLKSLKLGIGHNAILKAYHPDAAELYEATNNLKKVCDTLRNSKVRLHEIEIELFFPVKPMLSEECNFKNLDVYFKKSRYFYVEKKLDGERFQLHMKEGSFKYFSRNSFDYTTKFGSNCEEGLLTSRIMSRFHHDVKSVILDGEMMIWVLETGTFKSKASNVDVKSLKDSSEHQPCFCVFDVLYYNGQILTDKPLNYRLEILNDIFDPLEGVICCVPRKRVSTKEEIIDALNEAIDNREEGIVIKEFMSIYKPNIRKNGGWYKIKPEYVDGLSDTLDLLIIGGYFGSGRNMGNISHFLLGVAVNLDKGSELFYSVGRVGSGYSGKELSELQNKLQPYWNPTKVGEMPICTEWTKEKPDVWIEPKNSFILEIKAAEITSSQLFRTGYTLRFPRVENIRFDKSWEDCLTLEEFEEKRIAASGKLASQHLSLSNDSSGFCKKVKTSRSGTVLSAKYKGIEVSNIERISNLLNGKEICVFTGFGEIQKNEVEKKIVEHGGTLVQNPGKNTFCVLAEFVSNVRIKNLVMCESHDVIQTSWFYSQLLEEKLKLSELTPANFLALSKRTRQDFSKEYDEYEDHYTRPSTLETIKHPMIIAKNKSENISMTLDDKFKMDIDLFGGPSPYGIFRLCTGYFDIYTILEDSSSASLPGLEIPIIYFKFYGGKCSNVINDEVTHVVINSGDTSRLKEIDRKNRERNKKFHVVTEEWIENCLNNKSIQ